MDDEEHRRRLGRRCRATFGTGLRLSFWYALENGVEYGIVRFREDIRENYADADEARVVAANLVTDMRSNEPDAYHEQLPEAGSLQATTHVFEDAVVVHVPHENWGLVASYDADCDVDLVSFVEFCRQWLRTAAGGTTDVGTDRTEPT